VVVLDADPIADARQFEPVARAVEAFTPRLVLDRPGVLGLPTRGPARYFGGDGPLAARVREAVESVGVTDVCTGVADGAFASRLAARRATVVDPGETPAFLAPWPVSVLGERGARNGDDTGLVSLLGRLGLHTLGAFASLAPAAVLARFGTEGLARHRLASGLDEHPPSTTVPPPDLEEACELDPPADRVDAAAFAAKGLADRLLARLDALGLACTRVVVEAETEHGEHLARTWRHEGALSAAAVAERARWQLEGWLTATGGLTGGVTLVRLVPDQVIPATGRQLGFWGGDAAASDRAARALARVQGILGPDRVVTPVVQGGRTASERIRWVPWGAPREPEPGRPVGPVAGPVRVETPPWPGVLPGAAPARLLDPAPGADLLDRTGRPVVVSARGEPSGPPVELRCPALPNGGGPVAGWAGPWAQDVRWWDPHARARRAYWQVVVSDHARGEIACLVRVERGRATLEAIYD